MCIYISNLYIFMYIYIKAIFISLSLYIKAKSYENGGGTMRCKHSSNDGLW